METTRQQKIAKQIQKDVAKIFQKEGAPIVRGSLVTVTAVRISRFQLRQNLRQHLPL